MKAIFLVSLMTIFTLLTALAAIPFVAADDLNIAIHKVEANGIDITSGNVIAGEAGETVPVKIYFTAEENASEVEVSAWMQGHRDKAVEEDFRDLIETHDYIARLSLKLPTDIDPEENLILYVRIESDEGNWEESYTIGMQREPYRPGILFVEVDRKVEAGSSATVDVVVKNLGRHELEDLVVEISLPELGVNKRAYFGDLTPLDNWKDDDDEDVAERRVYLKIPADAESGIYELVVEAYNPDSRDVVTKNIEVTGAEEASSIVVPVTSKEIAVGQVESYDLVIVNSGNKVGVYEVIPEAVEGITISAKEPVITVPAGSSRVVRIEVRGVEEGTHSFSVNVNSKNKLVDKVTLTSVVAGKALRGNIVILTVVLAIVFIVLLIVLIVLLTRKPTKPEELEESYY
jgi:hypothetical protein